MKRGHNEKGNNMKNPFKVPGKPAALPIKPFCKKDDYTWEDWERDAKQAYPIRYFLSETLPSKVDFIKRKVSNMKYDFVSKHIKKDHLLDLTHEDNGGILFSEDSKLLYACINILKLFIEVRHGGIENFKRFVEVQELHLETDRDERRNIVDVYEWFMVERPKAKKELDDADNAWHKYFTDKIIENDGVTPKPRDLEETRLRKTADKLEEVLDKTDEEMLVKLMKARKYLW